MYKYSKYSSRPFLYMPFNYSNLTQAQRLFNMSMLQSRGTIECSLKEVNQFWTAVDFKRKFEKVLLDLCTHHLLYLEIRENAYILTP